MTRRKIELLIEIIVLALWVYAAWFFLRPAPISGLLTNVRGVICTPGRGQFEVMPVDFVGPPKPFPWPRPVAGGEKCPAIPEPPEPSDYLQKIGPHALLRVEAGVGPEKRRPVAGAAEGGEV